MRDGYWVDHNEGRYPKLKEGFDKTHGPASPAEVWMDRKITELHTLVGEIEWVRLNPKDPKTWPERHEDVYVWLSGERMAVPATFQRPEHTTLALSFCFFAVPMPGYAEGYTIPLDLVIYWRLMADGVDTPSSPFLGDAA